MAFYFCGCPCGVSFSLFVCFSRSARDRNIDATDVQRGRGAAGKQAVVLYKIGSERQIVIFRNRKTGDEYIKRVVGLPGERVLIREGCVYINGIYLDESDYLSFAAGELEEITVPPEHVFLLGDNRIISLDSRDESVGCVRIQDLHGSVFLRLLPLGSFTVFL